jgi:hypothetical protein
MAVARIILQSRRDGVTHYLRRCLLTFAAVYCENAIGDGLRASNFAMRET